MLKASIAKYGPPVASAMLLLAAFPPFNLSLLVFVALVPWFIQLRTADSKWAFRSGLVFGFVFLLGQMSWVPSLVHRWTGSVPLSLLPYILAALIGQFYFGLAGWLMRSCYRQSLPYLVPVAWAGIEVLRSVFPGLAFPWGLIATPLALFPPIIQHAFLGTVYLVGAWVVIVNVVVASLMSGEGLFAVRAQVMVWLVLLASSLARYGSDEPGKMTTVTVGQPGVDLAFTDSTTEERLTLSIAQIMASASLQGTRFVLLPEGLVRVGDTLEPEVPFARPELPPVVFGGQRGTGPVYQSAFAFDGKWSVADKSRLVVFGEYVPGRDWIPGLSAFRLPSGDLTPADHVSTLTVNGVTLGPLLCFEGLFWDVADSQARLGSQALAIMAIDDWYQGTPAPEQLSMMATWRAVETGLPVLRSATMGESLVVDGRGRTLARAPYGKTSALRVEVLLPDSAVQNPVRRYVPWAFLVALLGLPWAGRLGIRRSR